MNVKKYLDQLIGDIDNATQCGLDALSAEEVVDVLDWEVEKIQTQAFDEWCSIKQTQLPPDTNLDDQQVILLLEKLKLLLDAYNCPIVFQVHVPERLQYQVIRVNFNQQVPTSKVRYFTFSFCEESACRDNCLLGPEYCHCLLFESFFNKFAHRKEETEALDMDINPLKQYILKRRYGAQWFKEMLPEDLESWNDEDEIEDSPN